MQQRLACDEGRVCSRSVSLASGWAASINEPNIRQCTLYL